LKKNVELNCPKGRALLLRKAVGGRRGKSLLKIPIGESLLILALLLYIDSLISLGVAIGMRRLMLTRWIT
jgi:hypothetical protein